MNDTHSIREAAGLAPDCDALDLTERRPSLWELDELELDERDLHARDEAAAAPRTAVEHDHEEWFVVPDDAPDIAWSTACLQRPAAAGVPWGKLGIATVAVGCVIAIAAFALREDAVASARSAAVVSIATTSTRGGAMPAPATETRRAIAVAPKPHAPAAQTSTARAPAAASPRVTANAAAAVPKSSVKRAGKRRGPPPRASATRVAAAVAPKGMGTLMISTKPPCEIVIDGVATVLTTPQRALQLEAGRHKVTLYNLGHKIDATFEVVVEAGRSTKLVRDFLSKR